jgi:hypothetical protein
MSDQDMPPDVPASSRSAGRRHYNRRSTDVSPPYFEVFERIAAALERTADALGGRQISLDPPAPRTERPAPSEELRRR